VQRTRSGLVAGATALLLGLAGLGARDPTPQPRQQPTYLGTAGLEAALAELRASDGGGAWPTLGAGPTLAPGDRAESVAILRARLAASGEAPSATDDPLRFDAALVEALRAFQRQHGLEVDGKVGLATRAELDRSPRDRMRQIAETVAARRTLPADLGARFLLLNLPAFELEAVDSGPPALRLRVVVGTSDRPTPTLVSAVRGVVVHPFWNVPPRIARQEIAPRAARDPGYLEHLGIDVFAAGGAIAASGVDWRAFQRGEIDLVLRQRPGPLNALGAISLQFPNERNVCLHDTSDHSLFERARRDLSHGCVRVDRALDLARWLLAPAGEAASMTLERALAGSLTAELALPEPVPIYIVDWPVWVDADGRLQLRPEVYPERSQPARE
jgi:murein L,D-transpeptidase YcbB/YkuD